MPDCRLNVVAACQVPRQSALLLQNACSGQLLCKHLSKHGMCAKLLPCAADTELRLSSRASSNDGVVQHLLV